MTKKISIIMSIYNKEQSHYLNNAIESIWDTQTIKPYEIILIEDGVLTSELYDTIEYWKTKLPNILKVIPLPQNIGLAKALNIAINHCSGNYITRMDTDDIAQPLRFQEQLAFLGKNPDIDVVGTWITEIDENDQIIREEVKYPLTHDELFQFFAKRDPLAHPTVMFRKSFFDKAGMYSDNVHLAEDTVLWYSGFKNGCKFANIPYRGLKFRRSSNFYLRRANLKKSWGLLYYRLFHINPQLGYGITAYLYAIAYFTMALLPSFIKKWLYQNFR